MSSQASSQSHLSNGQDGQQSSDRETQGGRTEAAGEISQAERAAMHPEPHDVEWEYYFGAWSH